jgi:hypothetical protein
VALHGFSGVKDAVVLLVLIVSIADGLEGGIGLDLAAGVVLVLAVGGCFEGGLLVLWVILVFGGGVVVAEGDVFLGLPGVVALIVALPLDVAVLPVCIGGDLLFTHLICTTRSTSYSVSLYIV